MWRRWWAGCVNHQNKAFDPVAPPAARLSLLKECFRAWRESDPWEGTTTSHMVVQIPPSFSSAFFPFLSLSDSSKLKPWWLGSQDWRCLDWVDGQRYRPYVRTVIVSAMIEYSKMIENNLGRRQSLFFVRNILLVTLYREVNRVTNDLIWVGLLWFSPLKKKKEKKGEYCWLLHFGECLDGLRLLSQKTPFCC